jgi:3-carboxy-cis,cis-muconate cycloisomerase
MSSRPTFDPGFSTDALTAVYTPEATVAAILEFEAALARSLASAGLAPVEEAEIVAEACRHGVAGPADVLDTTWDEGTPIIALRQLVTAQIGDDAASRWFHFGATTQDAVDTAQMLQAKRALDIIEGELVGLARSLHDLTVRFGEQPHMARTFLQDARPTTFGFRTASWLDGVLGHVEESRRQRERLPVQLGGPVGTMPEYGEAAQEVRAALSRQLALGNPGISWHTDRSPILSLARYAEGCAMTMAKIAIDLALLASSAIGEITVRSGGSSSMHHKQNPIDSIRAVAASRASSGAVAMLLAGPPELDRGVGSWHVEWIALPLALQACGASVEAVGAGIGSLQVNEVVMSANAGSDLGDIGGVKSQIAAVTARFDRVIA